MCLGTFSVCPEIQICETKTAEIKQQHKTFILVPWIAWIPDWYQPGIRTKILFPDCLSHSVLLPLGPGPGPNHDLVGVVHYSCGTLTGLGPGPYRKPVGVMHHRCVALQEGPGPRAQVDPIINRGCDTLQMCYPSGAKAQGRPIVSLCVTRYRCVTLMGPRLRPWGHTV